MDNVLALNRAAERLNELSSTARAGKWTTAPSETLPGTTLIVAEWQDGPRCVAQARGALPEGNQANAEFIAAMDPRVAKKLALSMEFAADVLDDAAHSESSQLTLIFEAAYNPLIDVALEILGESDE